MPPQEPVKGSTVDIPAGRGIVRFIGTTQFSQGKWVGIELSEPKGKNDGSVMGITYFSCRMNYGVFVRPSQVKVLDIGSGPADAVRANVPVPVLQSVQRLGHQRQSSTSLGALIPRAPSARSIPSNSSRSASPAKPTTTPISSSLARTVPRLSTASPTKRSPQSQSSTPAAASSPIPLQRKAIPLRDSTPDFPVRSPHANETLSPQPPPSSPAKPRASSPHPPAQAPSELLDVGEVSSSPQEVRSPITPRPPSSARVREEQELRVRLRIVEARREEDAEQIRGLKERLAEAEGFVSLRPKLQAKLTNLQSELINTRRALSDAESLSSMSEMRLLEANEQLEMSLLDKEVAEERAEAAEAELETLKERLAVVEVELNVLKQPDEEEGEGGISGSARERLAFIQLEKQNERLKDALIRLRDLSAETEAEQRRKINELERDLASIDELQADYESNVKKLITAETQIEDLKQQLDDALGAEEMLVQLTERNLELGEKIEEMRLSIEELEMLKELADELEEQHIETEKALQEDLDAKDMEAQEQVNKIKELNASLEDYEGTINQFRDLVLQLQSELDTLRAETQTAQTESATQASKASQIMSINLKLQSTVSKSQAKNIDLELRKIEAREARELLSIVQPYLPQIYIDTDSDATSCYLFFQRMALKADLINNVVAHAHGLPDSLNGPVSESLVGVCEMRGRISHLSTLAKRFAAVLRRCDVESFLGIGRVYQEIAPIEKRMDMHIDLLKREEFRELECVSDVSKILAQFEHLAETYFSGYESDLGERELDLVLSFDSDLDMFAAAVGLTKTAIQNIQKDDDVVVEWGDSDIELIEPLQRLLDQCRGAKQISKKLVKRIEDMLIENSALKATLLPQLNSLSVLVSKGVDFAIQLAQSTSGYLADVRAAKHPFQLGGILNIVREIATATMSRRDAALPSWDDVSGSVLQLISDASAVLPLAMEAENVVKISGIPPWVHRIDEVKAALAVNVEAERKVAQLNEEMQDLIRGLKTRDQTIQESGVKIELMERRMEMVKKQADAITDLEAEVSKARKQERAYEEAMEQLQADLDALEQDNARLKTMAPNPERQSSTTQQGDVEPVTVEGNLETSHLLEQIEALRGAVRFLRNENAYLKGYDLLKEIQALPALESITRPPTPPLDRSPTPDSDESDTDGGRTRPTSLRTLATETKLLYRDVMQFSSTRRVVDLSVLNKQRMEHGKMWLPKKETPAHQVWEKKMEGERLSRRVKGLLERAQSVGVVKGI
ncbi:dynein associated protein-domain-containing protein [Hysterangium stoloniferum]|nr:dynein associated protein-domain-containing protein [Hysterangium stoloniferum]